MKKRRELSKRLSLWENLEVSSSLDLWPNFPVLRAAPILVGITGLPGAGKSTLVAKMIQKIRARGETVACILIDPSSPHSGGALLGDRIRIQNIGKDDGVFIRSLASRRSEEAFPPSVPFLTAEFASAGFLWVLIETVGAGQSQFPIRSFVDTLAVVLLPDMGDGIQLIKAGLLEVGDMIIVNKCDRGVDEILMTELSFCLENKVPLIRASTAQGEGLEEVMKEIERHREKLSHSVDPLERWNRYLKNGVERFYQVYRRTLEQKSSSYAQRLEECVQGGSFAPLFQGIL